MNLRTYHALSLNEALERIKADLGDDAVILHSRTFRRGGVLGVGGQTVFEVTASLPAPRQRPSLAARNSPPAPTSTPIPAAAAAPQTTVSNDPARKAAVALALAEQQRRRLVAAAESKPRQPQAPAATTPPPAPDPAPLLKRNRAHPTRQAVAPPSNTAADARTARPGRSPVTSASPVARRFVLAVDSGGISAAPPPVADTTTEAPPITSRAAIDRVAASIGEESPSTKAAEASPAQPSPRRRKDSRSARRRNGAAPQAGAPAPSLQTEIAALKQMVGQVLQRQAGTLQPAMPEALFNEYVGLIQNEVAQEIADDLCDRVRRDLREEQLADAGQVRASFRRHLAALVPVAPDSMLVRPSDGRPFTVALVGPTGVGKTTTVAKLAAAYKLRHQRRVGLITTDTYRIAAVDQLRTYANIIGLPLKVALTPAEMAEACRSLEHCDVILIDTAGRSPNDGARLEEIRAFAKAADPHEVHLVLASTCSEQVLMRTIERFSPVEADRVIFTKTDEAVSLGVLINVMRKAGKELSFITTGQEVPDHIEAGSPERLAALILGEKG